MIFDVILIVEFDRKDATVIEVRQGHKDHYVIPVLQFKTARNEEVNYILSFDSNNFALYFVPLFILCAIIIFYNFY